MGHRTDRPSPRRPGVLCAFVMIVAAVCALVIDCTTVHHDDHHGVDAPLGVVAVVAEGAGLAVPGHPLPDHCLVGTAAPDTGLVLPILGLLGALVVVLLASLGHPAVAARAPPRSPLRYRQGRDILTQFCICRR
ncbi:putative copper homeostasis (lipo)protein LpqS [Nocardia sp. NPDC055029]